MKKLSKRMSLVGAGLATATIAGASLFGSAAFAATTTGGTSLADKIAAKFNLKSEDVEAVITEDHQAHEKEHLDQAVTDGKITQAQEDLIIAKQAEIKPKMEAARALTDATARKTAMDALRTEMEQWAKDNGIDLGFVGPHGHGGMGDHMGPPPDTTTN